MTIESLIGAAGSGATGLPTGCSTIAGLRAGPSVHHNPPVVSKWARHGNRGVENLNVSKRDILHDVPIFHRHHPASEMGEGQVVGDHNDGLAAAGDFLEDLRY